MNFTILDWTAIAGYLLITLILGLYFRSRSGKSMDDYFLSVNPHEWDAGDVRRAYASALSLATRNAPT